MNKKERAEKLERKSEETKKENKKQTQKEKKEENKEKNKGVWRKIFLYSCEYKFELMTSAILTLPEAVVNIVGPKLSGELMNVLSQGANSALSGGGMDFGQIMKILGCLFVLYSFFLGCSCVSGYLTSNASIRLTYKMRKDISEKIARLPLNYFNKETYGEITSRITNDVDALVNSLTQILSQIISSTVMLAGIIYMMLSISWEMTCVSFLGTPIGFVFISLMIGTTQKYFKNYQKQLAKMNGHIEEMYSGHSVVMAFGGEKVSVEKFDELNKEMYNLEWKANFLSGFVSPIMEFVSSLTYVILCVMGGYFAMTRGILVGDIFAFLSYSNQFMKPLSSVAGISGTLHQIFSAAQRVFEFLDEEELPKDEDTCLRITDSGHIIDLDGTKTKLKGEVEFKDVIFSYDGKNSVIKNFSLKVKSGQTVAIVGPTGAGKTTITKLLTGFCSVQGGQILIDGHDTKKFKRRELCSLFGVVFQEPWLFNGTITENIRYGKAGSTDEEVKKAAKLACADGFINALPEGYDTVINESSNNISQGEKQLLTMARAVLANHMILILDEATSSIDTRTEFQIQNGLKALTDGMTAFVIAHRLSTIRHADLIVVMDNGEIAERGTHEELIQKKGIYYTMYVLQFEKGSVE